MTSLTATLISVIGIVTAVLAAPTTYDQRQDGDLNVAAKLENILILIALPSKTPTVDVDESELAGYLSLLGDRVNANPTHYDVSAETTNADSNDDEDAFSGEDESKETVSQPSKSSEEKVKSDVKVPKGRNLWGQLEDVVDNRQGGSLKKELSWGQNIGDDTSRSNDHNEVGLLPNGHLTLLGPGIEDCGPDRHRNSYGICASLPSE